jgi:hypothetical protein
MANRNAALMSAGLQCAAATLNIGLLWAIHGQQNEIQRHLDERNAMIDRFSRNIDKRFDDFSDRMSKV